MLPSKFSCTGAALSTMRAMTACGWPACSSSMARATAWATSSSLAPLARKISIATTGWPLTSATARGSATVSRTSATSPSRAVAPLASGMAMPASWSAVWAEATVRTVCSAPPTSPRPPGASCCTSASWRETSAAVTPRACMRSGSSTTCTSRVTPPTRLTAPTPAMLSRRLATVWSTYHESCCASQPEPGSSRSAYTSTTRPEVGSLLMMGSRMSAGRSERTCETASRTSVTASVMFFSSWNSTVIVVTPSSTVVYMFLMPVTVATESSILRATSVSSWAGAAPGWVTVTVTIGSWMSGKSCTSVMRKASSPASVSSANSRIAGTGLRMEKAEKFTPALRHWPGPWRAAAGPRPWRRTPGGWPPADCAAAAQPAGP